MKVAVIGSGSFLAKYIIKELSISGLEPVLFGRTLAPENKKFSFFKFEIPSSPIQFHLLLEFDAVIYCAGAGIQVDVKESTETLYYLNTFLPIHINNFLKDNNFKGKFITFGSYFEIGEETREEPHTEIDIITTLNTTPNKYSISKRLLTRFHSTNHEPLNFYHFILSNIYGKGENPNRLIPYLLEKIKNNDDVKLTSGTQIRQYIHAADVATIVVDTLLNNYETGIYNLTMEKPVKIKDLVWQLYSVLNKEDCYDERIFGLNARTDTKMPILLMNTFKAKTIFALQPKIDLKGGIESYLS